MNKRNFLKGAGGLLAAGGALGIGRAHAAEMDGCGRAAKPATFVLVHGAFSGGFYYTPMAELLRRKGHRVYVAELTGLGLRAHLLSRDVDMSMHVTDVSQIFKYEQLEDVVLVGHSYGGLVITGVADRLSDRIRSLVFLDALIAEDGKAYAELDGDLAERQAAWDRGEVGIPVDSDNPLIGPHPLGTAIEVVHLTGAWKTIPKKTYVAAMENQAGFSKRMYEALKDDPDWTVHAMEAGHGFPLTEPEKTAAFLEAAAG